MNEPLRFLLLEDSDDDADLTQRELQRAGLVFEMRRTETEADFRQQLVNFEPQLILSDYALPTYDGRSALLAAQELAPQTPFIFLTGAMGEEMAIEILKQGATDYVLKDRLERLVPAVERALQEAVEYRRRIRAETQIRYQASLLQNVSDAIVSTDPEFKILTWNKGAETIYGWPAEEVIGRLFSEVVPTRYLQNDHDQILEQFATDGYWHGEVQQQHKEGDWLHILSAASWIQNNEGQTTGAVVVNRNITKQKETEIALKESQELYQTIIASSPFPIVSFGSDSIVLTWNTAAETVFGWHAAEVIGRANPMVSADNEAEFAALRQRVQVGEDLTGVEIVQQNKDGDLLDLSMSAAPIRDVQGKIIGIMATFEDITAQKRIEKERAQLLAKQQQAEEYLEIQQRLATVGQLAAGIAHDFNNVMSIISLYTQLVQQVSDLPDKSRKYLQTVEEQAQHAARLIGQILDFSRRSIVERSVFNCLPLFKEMVKLLDSTLPETITITLENDAKEYLVLGDPIRLQQALMNMAVNARDAMPQGGNLRFSLRTLILNPEDPSPLPDLIPGQWLKIIVSDNGAGIALDHLPRIFDPFFTTKESGAGTGLGLSQVHGIIKQHQGSVTVESHVGQGATFTIYLPLISAPLTDWSPAGRLEATLSGSGTILLVEDKAAMRSSMRDALAGLGYHILEAENGAVALDLINDPQMTIDLVITDVVMPVMGGVELHRLTEAQRQAGLKMLFITGYPLDENFTSLRGLVWLQKPFDLQQLAVKVAALLN